VVIIARCYHYAYGDVKQNIRLALSWYQRAIGNGHRDAVHHAARIFATSKHLMSPHLFIEYENQAQHQGCQHIISRCLCGCHDNDVTI
jgi:TPR repeat protein